MSAVVNEVGVMGIVEASLVCVVVGNATGVDEDKAIDEVEVSTGFVGIVDAPLPIGIAGTEPT